MITVCSYFCTFNVYVKQQIHTGHENKYVLYVKQQIHTGHENKYVQVQESMSTTCFF